MRTESTVAIRNSLQAGREPLPRGDVERAAKAVAEVRHRWGWRFGKHPPRVMAIDLLIAEAAIRAFLEPGRG